MAQYKIRFNGGSAGGRRFDFTQFDRPVELRLEKGRATLTFRAPCEISPESLVTFQTSGRPFVVSREEMTDEERQRADVGYTFRDGFRKTYLLHALTQNAGLKISSIGITVGDGAEVEFTAESNPNFPFMSCMFPEEDLGLAESGILNSRNILDVIRTTSKTAADNDLRISALQAYMLSKTRKTELDRFLNLWTAMNAYYNKLAKDFQLEKSRRLTREYAEAILNRQPRAEHLFGQQREDVIDGAILTVQNRLSREKNVFECLHRMGRGADEDRARRSTSFLQKLTYAVPDQYLISSNDQEGIAAMMAWLCPGAYFPVRFSIENVHTVSLKLQACVAKCTDKGDADGQNRLHELYDTALERMTHPEAPANGFDPLFELAENCCSHLENFPGNEGSIPLYCYLLLAYPYTLRCNLFHGSKVQTAVAAYNDPEMLDYRVVCEFLDRFLTERLPQMFTDRKPENGWFKRLEETLRRRCRAYSSDRDGFPTSLPNWDIAVKLHQELLTEAILEQLDQYYF